MPMSQAIATPLKVDEHLVQISMLRAGGQAHKIAGLVAMYRAAVQDDPVTALILQRELRRFVAQANTRD